MQHNIFCPQNPVINYKCSPLQLHGNHYNCLPNLDPPLYNTFAFQLSKSIMSGSNGKHSYTMITLSVPLHY